MDYPTNQLILFSISDIGKVKIECNNGKYTIMGHKHDEFPNIENVKNGKVFSISGKELKYIINNTSYAAI